jgi:hypothetical protein
MSIYHCSTWNNLDESDESKEIFGDCSTWNNSDFRKNPLGTKYVPRGTYVTEFCPNTQSDLPFLNCSTWNNYHFNQTLSRTGLLISVSPLSFKKSIDTLFQQKFVSIEAV